MGMRMSSVLHRALICLGLAAVLAAPAMAEGAREALKVCADPNNLPFSNSDQSGFENKLAELLAEKLGLPLEYTWFPQRMGFIRNTLRAEVAGGGYKCDLVMGVPAGYERAITTDAYYRSTYAMVFPEGSGLDSVEKPDDLLSLDTQKLASLRFGVFERSPAMDWLKRHNLHRQAIAFPALSGDPDDYPGQLVDRELANGNIDVAMLWGPIAGYFAGKADKPMKVVAFPRDNQLHFDFGIAAGVRFGDGEWRDQVQQLLNDNAEQVEAILREYNVPLLSEDGSVM